MADVTIYHNPSCSKSRETLELIRGRGIEPNVIEYLKMPPDAKTLSRLLIQLGIDAADLLRKKEDEFSELSLANKLEDRKELISAMAAHPILIERPIVVCANRACLGRPPEQVLEIL